MNKAFFTVTVFAVQIVSATLAFGAEPLSVMSFGGSYQEAQRKAVFQSCPSSNDLRLFGLWKNGVSGSGSWLI